MHFSDGGKYGTGKKTCSLVFFLLEVDFFLRLWDNINPTGNTGDVWKEKNDKRDTMEDEDKTKTQLIAELKEMRRLVSEFEKSETLLKQAEETLKEEAIRRRMLVEQSRDGIVVLDQNGKVYEANQRYADMLGYSMEEVLQLHVWDWDAQWTREQLMEMVSTVDETGDRFETSHRRKDGTLCDVEISTNGTMCGGQKLIFCVCRDITARKRLEEHLRNASKMEALGTLVGGIAHEFNNVLAIILGNAELSLVDIPEWSSAYYNLEEIRAASLRAKDVVRQLLSYIRKIEYTKKPLKLIPVIKDSISFLRATIPTNIDIHQNIKAADDSVLADPTQINQVMINLCMNAFHAMEETGGNLEIEIHNVVLGKNSVTIDPALAPGNYVKLTVSDTGEGIPPQIIDRIFDPFFTTKEVGKGSGMGLSVVHGIVKSCGGSLSVESEPGKGTTVSLFFPVVEGEADSESKPVVEESPTGSERILFIDDEKSIVNIAREILERLGYQVETKMDPAAALELFRSKPDEFDLVITDMAMPKMTGDTLVKKILTIRPDIPTILCTGFSERISEETANEVGIKAFLSKPLVMHEFAVTVRKALDEA